MSEKCASLWTPRATERSESVADIVQCGLVIRNLLLLRGLNDAMEVAGSKLLILWHLWGWLLGLDSNQPTLQLAAGTELPKSPAG